MASETALTFSVELGFMVTVNHSHYDNQAALWSMTEVFLQNLESLAVDLPCACITNESSKPTGEDYQYNYPTPDKVPMENNEWKDHYCLSESVTVLSSGSETAKLAAENKRAVGLELFTRVLDFDKQGCPELRTTFTAISKGGKLRNKEIAEEFKPSTHSKAGLSVHIGVKDGLSLETARQAAVLGWLLEPCLFSLCNDDRGMTWLHAPIRKHSDSIASGSKNVNTQIEYTFSDEERMRIRTILAAGNMNTLLTILSGAPEDPAAQRLSLAIRERGNDHTTIEFRHFQSTMDYELAWKWIRIAASLVQVASKPASEFDQKLQLIANKYQVMKYKWRLHMLNRTFSTETTDPWLNSWKWMLPILDLQDDIPFWRDYVARLPRRNKQTWGDVTPLVG
ncbi:hypothetical protein F4814DRAFT_443709 [Daldinia grandis]|nr:hypothetical protein F4814DRAFT_443709 [Daldinia grandis]